MTNRIITSGGQVVSTVSGLSSSNNSKPVVVNTSQLSGGVRQQMVVTSQSHPVRTVQFKQSSQAQTHSSSGVSGRVQALYFLALFDHHMYHDLGIWPSLAFDLKVKLS